MSAKQKTEEVKDEPGSDLAAERDAALAEKKTVIELPATERSAPALRVDN